MMKLRKAEEVCELASSLAAGIKGLADLLIGAGFEDSAKDLLKAKEKIHRNGAVIYARGVMGGLRSGVQLGLFTEEALAKAAGREAGEAAKGKGPKAA